MRSRHSKPPTKFSPAAAHRPQSARRSPVLEPLEGRMLMAGDLDFSFSGDGKLTTDFGAGSVDTVYDVAVQPDGKVVVVGESGDNWAVARYNVDGSLDTTFGPTGSGKVVNTPAGSAIANWHAARAVAIQPDGKIVVAGAKGFGFAVVRLLPNGQPDTTFSGDGLVRDFGGGFADESAATDVVIQKDGKIVVVGEHDDDLIDALPPYDDQDFAVARYLPNGSLDHTFGTPTGLIGSLRTGKLSIGFGGDEYASSVEIDYNGTAATNPHYGKIIVAGVRTGGSGKFAVARLRTNGTLDGGFDGDGKRTIAIANATGQGAHGVAALPGGRVVAVGAVTTGSVRNAALLAFRSNGALDLSFNGVGGVLSPILESANDVVVGQGGKLLVGGTAGGNFAVMRFTSSGAADTTFGATGNGRVTTDLGATEGVSGLALAPNGKFVAAGTTSANGGDFAVARYFDQGQRGIPGGDTVHPGGSVAINPDPALPVTLAAAADAYVRDGTFAGTNFGSDSSLVVKKGPVGFNRESYLRFDLGGVGAVNRAVLRLYGKLSGSDNTNVPVSVSGVADMSWTESGITWNNRPPGGPTRTSVTVTDATARWYEFDVTAYVRSVAATGKAGFAVGTAMETIVAVIFNSDENAGNRPQLVIT
jgi:uncharacterized delta-60 repeat protein